MDKKYPDGINFSRPNAGAPDFIKGKMGVNMGRFLKWIEENNISGEWLNFDLLQSKDKTKLYFSLNDWKATASPQRPRMAPSEEIAPVEDIGTEVPYPTEEINPGDIPF